MNQLTSLKIQVNFNVMGKRQIITSFQGRKFEIMEEMRFILNE